MAVVCANLASAAARATACAASSPARPDPRVDRRAPRRRSAVGAHERTASPATAPPAAATAGCSTADRSSPPASESSTRSSSSTPPADQARRHALHRTKRPVMKDSRPQEQSVLPAPETRRWPATTRDARRTACRISARPPSHAGFSSPAGTSSPARVVQAQRPARDESCPGKLLHSSGRLEAHKRSENPGQLQPATCAAERRKICQRPAAHAPAEVSTRALDNTTSLQRETSGWSGAATSQPSRSLSASQNLRNPNTTSPRT
jgi:hypothetical protein